MYTLLTLPVFIAIASFITKAIVFIGLLGSLIF
jgi:hypothetical protein